MGSKVSKYNIYIPYEEGTYLVFNSLTSALAKLKEENYQQLLSFPKDDQNLDDQFITDLRKCGFIVDSEYDELLYIRRKMFEERFAKDDLSLTVAPTMECNFNCEYCFENGQVDGKMDAATMAQLVKFVDEHLCPEGRLSVCWMGGEPLMVLDVITELACEFQRLCREKNCTYYSSIVTNGYLLDPEIASRLSEINVGTIQITLDGERELHNKKRPLKNGGPTFDKIVNNIIDSIDILNKFVIRVNLDQENFEKADQIMDVFDRPDLKEKIALEFSLINAFTDEMKSRCLENKEFNKIQLRLNEQKISRGFIERKYPARRFNPCGVTLGNSFVIDSRGRIYHCWTDYGHYEKSTGSIFDIQKNQKQLQLDSLRLLHDSTEDEECRECKFLPICMGGCYWVRNTQGKTCKSEVHLEETLKLFVKNKLYEQITGKGG